MDTTKLRDKLMHRLVDIVEHDEELSPAMVSACVNFLKQFPPPEELADLPTAKRISESLKKYQTDMPFAVVGRQ